MRRRVAIIILSRNLPQAEKGGEAGFAHERRIGETRRRIDLVAR